MYATHYRPHTGLPYLLEIADDFQTWWAGAGQQARVVAGTGVGVAAVAALTVIWGFLKFLAQLILWFAGVVGDTTSAVIDEDLVDAVTGAVTGYLREGAAAMSVPANTLITLWAAVLVVVYAGALVHMWGARIAWVALGAATVAMTYAGATGQARGTAAAVTLAAWALLSIPAFWSHARSVPITMPLSTRPDPEPVSPLGPHANARYERIVGHVLDTWRTKVAARGPLAGAALHATVIRGGWIGAVQLVPGQQHTGSVREHAEVIREAYGLSEDQLEVGDNLSADLATIRVFAAPTDPAETTQA